MKKLWDRISWKHVSIAGALAICALWAWAELAKIYPRYNVIGDIDDVALLARLSYITAIFTFVAAWRADVPTKR